MAVKYRLVLRKDMSKDAPADGKLVYAVSSSTGMCDTYQMCEIIADRSAATLFMLEIFFSLKRM